MTLHPLWQTHIHLASNIRRIFGFLGHKEEIYWCDLRPCIKNRACEEIPKETPPVGLPYLVDGHKTP